jgi:hypothetical protein
MDESMIERVARALFENRVFMFGVEAVINPSATWDELCQETRDIFARDARAAIEAMREPTDVMLKSGLPYERANWTDPRATGIYHAWTEMIDAALK